MRRTTHGRTAARLDGSYDLQGYRIRTRRADRATAAIGVCLFACLLLHADISTFTSSAYASTWPAGSSQGSVCLAFGEAYAFDNSTYTHRGVDMPANAGDAVRAPLDGVVTFVGRVPSGDSIAGDAGQEETMTAVSIKLGDGKTVTLMPLGSTSAKKGQKVAEGEAVGTLAATGDRSSRAPHLHMGLKEGRRYCDPMSLFGEAAMQTTLDAEASAVALPKAGASHSQARGLAPDAAGAVRELEQEQVESSLSSVDAEPSFRTISSAAAETGFEGSAASERARLPFSLDAVEAACSEQLSGLLAGYVELGEKTHLPANLLLFASVLLSVLVATAVVAGVITLIRRNAAHEKVRKNSSLYKGREDASIYGLFPAPGTSFITRGRLAQRR